MQLCFFVSDYSHFSSLSLICSMNFSWKLARPKMLSKVAAIEAFGGASLDELPLKKSPSSVFFLFVVVVVVVVVVLHDKGHSK